MSKARLIITAITVEHCTQAEAARRYGVSPGWVSKLMARYRAEGDAALEPRSRAPKHSPTRINATTIALIVQMRTQLLERGLDAGAHTIAWHLHHHHSITVAPATIWRHLRTVGLIEPQPQKRPRSSYIRFEAALPNETWQADFTHWPLSNGTDTEILSFIDDHSRYALSITAHHRITGPIVRTVFAQTTAEHGLPASTLTDNGMVFTTRLSGGRGQNGFEHDLARLGIQQKNGHPYHPQTQGKVERFQQTLKKWLSNQPKPADLIALQLLLDAFVEEYNHRRPHRALERTTPAAAYAARPKATPNRSESEERARVRTDTIDNHGRITLRHAGRLHHIGLGRTLARTRVIVLIDGLEIRVVHRRTGELIRELTLDTTRDYQPQEPKNPRT
ncbi:IS481 family transposase [Plantibacter sp. YIM 135347]|uniref:IS481 family transposase n=1 Tax=Plantibacter sp. YIM 135347 TaxID=3423919 RepID=UPI003D35056F